MVKHYIYVFARSVAVRCILGRGAGRGYVRVTILMQKLTELHYKALRTSRWRSVHEPAPVASDLSRSIKLPHPARSRTFLSPTQIVVLVSALSHRDGAIGWSPWSVDHPIVQPKFIGISKN